MPSRLSILFSDILPNACISSFLLRFACISLALCASLLSAFPSLLLQHILSLTSVPFFLSISSVLLPSRFSPPSLLLLLTLLSPSLLHSTACMFTPCGIRSSLLSIDVSSLYHVYFEES